MTYEASPPRIEWGPDGAHVLVCRQGAAKGPRAVEILDTQWIEPGLGELCALAFEPAGHRIACLGVDGRVEIAPVP